MCLLFAEKASKNEKTKHMFPLKHKKHDMNTRKTEKFEVQSANTDRLKNFSLIYMQKLLNEKEQQK